MQKDLNNIVINDDKNRLIEGYASVEIVDRQGDIVPSEALQKAMLEYMRRGGMILYGHENKPVGKVLQWEVKNHPDFDVPAIKIVAQINQGYSLDDALWNMVKNKQLRGFSIGGTAISTENRQKGNQSVRVLSGLELSEISVVGEPANQGALITATSLAKADESIENKLKKLKPDGLTDDEFEVVLDAYLTSEAYDYMTDDEVVRTFGQLMTEPVDDIKEAFLLKEMEKARQKPEYIYWNYCTRKASGIPEINNKKLAGGLCGYLYWYRFNADRGMANKWAIDGGKISDDDVRLWLTGIHHIQHPAEDIVHKPEGLAHKIRSAPRALARLVEDKPLFPKKGIMGLTEADEDKLFESLIGDGSMSVDEFEEILERVPNDEDRQRLEDLGYGRKSGVMVDLQNIINRNKGRSVAIVDGDVKKSEVVEVQKPFAGFKNFAACERHMKNVENYSDESAKRVCGSLKHKYEKGELGDVYKAEYDWNTCMRQQTSRYGDKEKARKVCGSIKVKYGKSLKDALRIIELEIFKYQDDIGDSMRKDSVPETMTVVPNNQTKDDGDCKGKLVDGGMSDEDAGMVCEYLTTKGKVDEKTRGRLFALLGLKRKERKKGESMNIEKDEEERLVAIEEDIKQIKSLLEELVGEEAALGDEEEEVANLEEDEIEEAPVEAGKSLSRKEKRKANIGGNPKEPEKFQEDAGLTQRVRNLDSIPDEKVAEGKMHEGKGSNVTGGIKDGQDNALGRDSTTERSAKVETLKGDVKKANLTVGSFPKVQSDVQSDAIYNGEVAKGVDFMKSLKDVLSGKDTAKAIRKRVQNAEGEKVFI